MLQLLAATHASCMRRLSLHTRGRAAVTLLRERDE